MSIGGFGSGQNLTYMYFGTSHTSNLFRLYPNSNESRFYGSLKYNNKEVATTEEVDKKLGKKETADSSATIILEDGRDKHKAKYVMKNGKPYLEIVAQI